MWSCRPQPCGCSGGGLGCGPGFLLATSVRSFPAPARLSAGGKNFSLVTPPGMAVRNSLPAWVKSRIQLGAREPGTPGRRAAEGEGTAPAPSRGTSRGPRGRGRGARPVWAALGLRPHSRAARVLSRVRRPRPAPSRLPPPRAGADRPRRLEGVRPSGSPTGRPCLCHSRSSPPVFPPPSLRLPQSSFPAAAAARSPQELAGPRRGPRLRRAPPRHLHSSGRRRWEARRRRERRRRRTRAGPGRGGGSFCLTGRGGNSATAPAARGPRLRAAAAAAATGAGRPPAGAPQPPTAGRRPARASQRSRGLRGRRRRRRRGARAGDRGLARRCAAGGPPPEARAAGLSPRPREASAAPADRVSLYDRNWCKEVVQVQPRFPGSRYLFQLLHSDIL